MIDSHDITSMQADIDSVIADDAVSITIRRDSQNLSAQTVRLVKPGPSNPRQMRSDAGKEVAADIIVLGDLTLDIKKGDKFIYQSLLHEVIWIDPGQDIAIEAEAVIRG